jgi:hypothetical protein
MPPGGNARLTHAARHKIEVLLRTLYNHWLAQGVPERTIATIRNADVSGSTSRSGHQPTADRGVH